MDDTLNSTSGVTSQGGTSPNCANGANSACGTIFQINSTGSSYAVLYSFDGTMGSDPLITLLQHTNGLLYGLASVGGVRYDPLLNYMFRPNMTELVKALLAKGANPNVRIKKNPPLPASRKLVFNAARAAPFPCPQPPAPVFPRPHSPFGEQTQRSPEP